MKEIIYIQAGNLSNYIGTHFWNTQESYLADEDSKVDHEISFRTAATTATQDDPILCPRLFLFDWKGNFGTLNRSNSLGKDENGQEKSDAGLWNGSVEEIRQLPIPQSAYQQKLDEEAAAASYGSDPAGTSISPHGLRDEQVRYWSDYSRVYYTPNTIQPVHEPPDRNNPNGNWGIGVEAFRRYNEDQDLMEDSVRLALEECDSLQGLQIINDCESFGGFIASFLTAFKDDYSRTSTLAFPVLSSRGVTSQAFFDMSNAKGIQSTMSDILYLRALYELGSLSVPIQTPSVWGPENWRDVRLPGNMRTGAYYSSAILAAHIESATLPLRLGSETLPSFAAKINRQASHPFAELYGRTPIDAVSDTQHLSNFTSLDSAKPRRYAKLDVTRGLSGSEIPVYDAYPEQKVTSMQSVVRYHSPAYPLPSSFPASLWPETMIRPRSASSPLATVKGISSISSGDNLAPFFKRYANFAEECLRRKDDAALGVGIDLDELREVVNDLWTLHDGYSEVEDA